VEQTAFYDILIEVVSHSKRKKMVVAVLCFLTGLVFSYLHAVPTGACFYWMWDGGKRSNNNIEALNVKKWSMQVSIRFRINLRLSIRRDAVLRVL